MDFNVSRCLSMFYFHWQTIELYQQNWFINIQYKKETIIKMLYNEFLEWMLSIYYDNMYTDVCTY